METELEKLAGEMEQSKSLLLNRLDQIERDSASELWNRPETAWRHLLENLRTASIVLSASPDSKVLSVVPIRAPIVGTNSP